MDSLVSQSEIPIEITADKHVVRGLLNPLRSLPIGTATLRLSCPLMHIGHL